MTSPHPHLSRVFRGFDTAAVSWVLLRGMDDLAAPEGDIDLLIDPRDRERAELVLRDLLFVRVPTVGRGTHRFHLGYGVSEDRWFKLDLVTEVSFGSGFKVRTNLASGCLERRRREGDVWALAADDAFWLLLLHGILDKGLFPPSRASALRAVVDLARTDSGGARIASQLLAGKWNAAKVIEAVLRDDLAELAALAPHSLGLRRRVWGRATSVMEALQLLRARPGLSVSLLGPDGAGKSTVAHSVVTSFPYPARTVYLGLWKRPAKKGTLAIPGSDLARRVAFAWRQYLIGRFHRALRRVVVFDRYTLDARLGTRREMGLTERLYLGILARAIPSPDLILVLDVPGEVAFTRKHEHSAPQLERDRQAFRAIAARARGELLDASRPAAEVQADVMDRVWRAYARRWGR